MKVRFTTINVAYILVISACSCAKVKVTELRNPAKLPSLHDLFSLSPHSQWPISPMAIGRRSDTGIYDGFTGFPRMHNMSDPEFKKEAELAKYFLDIESLDMPKFKRSMADLANQMLKLERINITAAFDSTIPRKPSDNIKGVADDTRRIGTMNLTRRALPLIKKGGSWHRFETKAVPFQIKSKILDAKLTLIYMARHKIRELEKQPLFNTKDTSYRLAYVFKRLGKYKTKMHNIWSSMVNHELDVEQWKIKKDGWPDVQRYIKYHQKVWKLYTDFMYLWWVIVRLHEAFCRRNHIYITRPSSSTTTTKKGPNGR